MRKINDHQVSPADAGISVTAIDEPGNGGACHHYAIDCADETAAVDIHFQNGPVAEVGINGVTNEALLAVVIDRMRSFQAGAYACKANACALTHMEEAMHWLQQRTIERMRRGVEGTSVA